MNTTPTHTNDCECCNYLGSQIYPQTKKNDECTMDFYMCEQNGLPTVIGRFGNGADYVSSLGLPKMIVREMIRDGKAKNYKQGLEKLITMNTETFDVIVLSQAALLAQEAGLLDEVLQSVSSAKPKNKMK